MDTPFEAWQLERAVLTLEDSTLPRTLIVAAVEFRDSVLIRRGGVAFKEEGEIKQASTQPVEILQRRVKSVRSKTYKQPAFNCYGDYKNCLKEQNPEPWICAGLLIICLAAQVIPLAGGGGRHNHHAGKDTE